MSRMTHPVRVIILTQAHHVKGQIEIPVDQSLAACLIEAADFIAVHDASVWTPDGTMLFSTEHLAVHRSHIEIIIPAELTA